MEPRGLSRGPALAAASLALVALCSACVPSDPLERKLNGSDPTSFAMSTTDARTSLSPEQVADLDQALQQIKFAVMAEGKESGGDAVASELIRRVDGKTVRAVIEMGFRLELLRALAERDSMTACLVRDAAAKTAPGDFSKADLLDHIREAHTERLRSATVEIAQVRARLTADGLGPR
jgi:hypothetical protein